MKSGLFLFVCRIADLLRYLQVVVGTVVKSKRGD